MKIRAIALDKDGTFVDFNATWGPAIDEAMRTLAGDDAAAYQRLCAVNHFDPVTRRLAATSPFIAEASADFARRWATALNREMNEAFHAAMDRLLDAGALANVAPIGNPAQVLQALRSAGHKLGVITNDTEAGARNQCAKLGLASLFDSIIGYDSGHGRKPAPGQILAFANQHNLVPEEIAMVGDTLHDLHAARAAGALAIGVLSGFAGREELATIADHVIDDISALPALLGADYPAKV